MVTRSLHKHSNDSSSLLLSSFTTQSCIMLSVNICKLVIIGAVNKFLWSRLLRNSFTNVYLQFEKFTNEPDVTQSSPFSLVYLIFQITLPFLQFLLLDGENKKEESAVFKCTITHHWHRPELTQTDGSIYNYYCDLKGHMITVCFHFSTTSVLKRLFCTSCTTPLKFFQVFLLTEYLCYAIHITHTSPLFKRDNCSH